MSVLDALQLVDLIMVEPQTPAMGTTINDYTLVSDFLHAVMTFGTLQAVYRCIVFHNMFPETCAY
jgi:hypothetical protein